MKPTTTAPGGTKRSSRFLARASAAWSACALLLTSAANGGSVVWSLNANGDWDTATANWTGDDTIYKEGDAVTFGSVITADRTISIQPAGVTPSAMTVNNPASVYTFSGGNVLGGAFLLTSPTTAAFTQNASPGFSSVTVQQGTLRWDPAAPDDASVLPAHSFCAGGVALGAPGTAGAFHLRGTRSVPYTLSHNWVINAGTSTAPGTGMGGTITLGGLNATPTAFSLPGSIALGGNLTISQNNRPVRLNGSIAVVGASRRITFASSGGIPDFTQTSLAGDVSGNFGLEIHQNAGNAFRPLVVSGDNTGLTGGITVQNRGLVIFASESAMGGGAAGSVTVVNNTYAGFAFTNFGGSSASGALSMIATASQGNLGLDADSSAAINLAGFNSNICLGSASRATCSGTLTPQSTEFRIGGGGGHLTITSVLADGAGSRTLSHRNVSNVPSSITTLTAANTYSGATTVMNGILAAEGAAARLGQGAGAHVTVDTGAMLSLSHAGQVDPAANLTVNGLLILDAINMSDLLAGRTGTTTIGSTAGFAARGATCTVGEGDFDRNVTLGTNYRDWNGEFYANAPVDIAASITLTANRTITVAATGPGTLGTWQGRVAPRISGGISGGFVPFFTGGGADDTLSEVVLAGANGWTGHAGAVFNGPQAFNVGAGGYLNALSGSTGTDGADVYVRFDGQASLPTGNGGNPAYLAALKGLSGGQANRRGILLTSRPDGEAYRLPNGYRIVIGGVGNRGHNGVLGATSDGSLPGTATLRDSDVVFHWGHPFPGGPPASSFDGLKEERPISLMVRDGVFALGTQGASPNGPVRFVPAKSEDLTVPTTATVLLDDDRTGHYLVKRGPGTLILQNVAYTLVDGSGDTSPKFVWNVGRNSANTVAAPYFDGAVRGRSTSADDVTATLANSLFAASGSFALRLRGGVYEVDANGADTRAFTAAIGTGAGQVNWGAGGGGFSACNGALRVDLGGSSQEWSASNFVGDGNPLIFGSQTATHDVTWVDPLGLDNADNATTEREIRVIARAVEFEAGIRNRGAGTSGGTGSRSLIKTGAGILRFVAGATFDYNGTTAVRGGTLEVNQNWSAPGGTVTVSAAGRLGGTGTVTRDVVVQAGGALAPGASAGTLTLGNVTVAEDGAYEWEFQSDTSGQADKTIVSGDLTFTGPWTVRLVQLGAVVPGQSRYVLFDVHGDIAGFDPAQATVEPGETEWLAAYVVDRSGDQIVLRRATQPGTMILVR